MNHAVKLNSHLAFVKEVFFSFLKSNLTVLKKKKYSFIQTTGSVELYTCLHLLQNFCVMLLSLKSALQLEFSRNIYLCMEQKPIKKKTEDTEKVYFALYFLGSS